MTMAISKAAEEGAKAENASGVDVAKALTSAMRDYYPTVSKASDVTKVSADVMSKFIATTSAGLANALGKPDGQKLAWQDLLACVRRIADAVKAPAKTSVPRPRKVLR